MKTFAIAIDGTSGSGKGTLARQLSAHYGFPALSTGLLYRAIAASVLAAGGSPTDFALACKLIPTVDFAQVKESALHQGEIGAAASTLAQYPEVRAQLTAHQRAFAAQGAGAIVEGRDIGTIILPNAPVKFFVDGDLSIRAKRRFAQKKERGEGGFSLQDIETELKVRDERDKTRTIAPLARAHDAHLLDTGKWDIVKTTNQAIQIIDAALAAGGSIVRS